MGAPRFVLDRFWPSNLFLGGIPGAWYDPTDLSTMFQDSTGTTPVTAVEQPVGCILDKSGNANHATQATAASRPTYRARYNMVEQSEVFNNAYWTKSSTTISADAGTAPDGTATADLVYPTTTGTARIVWRNLIAGINGQRYTLSVYAKASGKAILYFGTLQGNTAPDADLPFFNLTTGQVSQAGAYFDTVTIQSVGSGWYRCTATKNAVTSANLYPIFGVADASGNTTATTNGTDGVLLWGAQLLTAADVTATGNAYQRIAAATVYDTAPIFRPYLAFDGVDDSLSTAAINFTATDKMSVFSGVTKNTDGSAGCVAELSATAITNNGSFALFSSAGGAVWYVAARGTALGSFACATFTAPITNTVSGMINIAEPALASELIPRINATINQTGASGIDIGTGNFGNWPLYIGRRGGTTLPFNGRLYSLIVRGAASSVTEIADTELWVNARTGAF